MATNLSNSQMPLHQGVTVPKEYLPPIPSEPPLLSGIGQLAPTAASLAAREVIPENNRDGGLKYFEALKTLQGVLDGSPGCEKAIAMDLQRSQNPSEKIFLQDLIHAIDAIKGSTLPIRERNTKMIQYLRSAIKSHFYQQNKASGNVNCALLQALCHAKFTKVFPSESFKELVENAALSANPHALDGLTEIDKHTVGAVTREINGHLHNATTEYSKGTVALWLQKARGEFGGKYGLVSDPCGTSNVPYLRSRFGVDIGAEKREIEFCRFGTPTIQEGGKTEIDPMLLSALDAMNERGQNFLYVNHQKLEGREGVRANAIAAVQETHENFHFLSIPLDGPIVDLIRNPSRSIDALKNLIHQSFARGINGCRLPPASGFSSHELESLLHHVHSCWFAGKEQFTTQDFEAFWGIFNTTLKHCMIKKLNIHAMNSSCKDNKDRGGTLGTIDEAVRNVLLGHHQDPVRLRELVNNALAPFMIKLEHILDDPSKSNHHRLGYLVSVLNHIATIGQEQVEKIRRFHSKLCFTVTSQEMSPKPRVTTRPATNDFAIPPVKALPLQPEFTENDKHQLVTTTTTSLETIHSFVKPGIKKIEEPTLLNIEEEEDELMVSSDTDEPIEENHFDRLIRENHFA